MMKMAVCSIYMNKSGGVRLGLHFYSTATIFKDLRDGAVAACLAHNQEVRGSIPLPARICGHPVEALAAQFYE